MTENRIHLGPAGINSRGYAEDRGVIWPGGQRPDGIFLRPKEEIISSKEYFRRLEKQSNV